MKYLLATISLLAVTATPALADTSKANIKDHYKVVIEQTPYNVEVCKDVRLQKSGTNTEGAIIGGILGNNIKGENNGGAIGAIIGGMLGHSNSTATGGTQRRCVMETRYKETSARVYSHSTITFTYEGKTYSVGFEK